MSAASYARVSTAEQSAQQQLDRLRAAAPGSREFVDTAVSGRLDSRPAFDRLRAEIERGDVDAVFVTRLDRLGRSARAIISFFEFAEARGVRVVVTDQGPIDTSTAVGRLVRTVLAAMAELEADLIRDRTRDAMTALKAGTRATRSGRPVGRPPRVTQELIADIRRLRDAERLRWAQVAVRLHVPASSARKWYSNARAAEKARVINGAAGFAPPSVDMEDGRSP